MAGREVRPAIEADLAHLAGAIGPRGLGAVLAVALAQLEPDMPRFLEQQASLHQRASSDTTFPARTAQLTPVAATTRYAADALPGGMAALAGVRLEMQTELRVRECGFYEAQSPEPLDLPYLHTHTTFGRVVHLAPYAIDLAPVTNAQYAEFLRATGYQPEERYGFAGVHARGVRPRVRYQSERSAALLQAFRAGHAVRWRGRHRQRGLDLGHLRHSRAGALRAF
jgi:formylglycine-generating enzyme required for sulfatase activity